MAPRVAIVVFPLLWDYRAFWSGWGFAWFPSLHPLLVSLLEAGNFVIIVPSWGVTLLGHSPLICWVWVCSLGPYALSGFTAVLSECFLYSQDDSAADTIQTSFCCYLAVECCQSVFFIPRMIVQQTQFRHRFAVIWLWSAVRVFSLFPGW